MFSQYHPNGPCRSCFCMCSKSSNYYTHFESWSIEEKNFITHHHPVVAYVKSIRKKQNVNHSIVGYTPKWKKLTGEVEEKIRQGSDLLHTSTMLRSQHRSEIDYTFLCEAIDNHETAFHVKSSPEHRFVLCSKHYQEVYNCKKGAQPCTGCGVKPKVGTCFTRHSPDASTVSQVLHENIRQKYRQTYNGYFAISFVCCQ